MINEWTDFMEILIICWPTYKIADDNENGPVVVEVPGAIVLYEEDLLHNCTSCGAELEIVRPGKYQCPNCE